MLVSKCNSLNRYNTIQYNTNASKFNCQNNVSFKEENRDIKYVSAQFAVLTASVFAAIVLLEEAMRGGGTGHQLLSSINTLKGNRFVLDRLLLTLESAKAEGVAVPATLSLGISSLIKTITNAINRATQRKN